MGLYKMFEKSLNNKTLKNYESIIKEINKYYFEFSQIYKKEQFLESQIDMCIRRGNEAFNEYLGEYVNSNVVDEDFLRLKSRVHNFSIKQTDLERCYKLIDLMLQTSLIEDKEEILKKDYTNKLECLFNITINNKDSYNDVYLFMIGVALLKEYKELFNSIKPDVDEQINKGNSFIDSIKYVMKLKGVSLDGNKILSTFYTVRNRQLKYNNKLREEYKDKYIKNFFISETNKLKLKVKKEIENGKNKEQVLSLVLPMAYGLVKAACEYSKKILIYDVQLMGAIAMNEGKIAEMYTGEGKTLTAIFPAYLNALTNQEVNIFTPNDYLSSRDAKDNIQIYNLLGLTVGCTLVEGQTIEDKKKAYQSDIVYGSSNAFAFDFLKDTNAKKEQTVGRGQKPGFVIVDEADQILINNALNPYQLTGGANLTKQDIVDNQQIKYFINLALEIEKMLSKNAYIAKTQYEYECITGDNKEYTAKMNDKYSLLIGIDEVYLTTKGEKELFYYFMYEKAKEIIKKASDYFKTSDFYTLGIDYLLKDDSVVLTVEGFDKACQNIQEFSELNMQWLTNEESLVIRKYLNNALVARYIMQKGKHYQVGIDQKTYEQRVFVLQDGRIMPDSKFTEGLHQALEVKEGLDIQISDGERLMDSVLATISNRALLSRYDKVSGMTGTAPSDALKEIYGLDTFKTPRNKEYLYKKGLAPAPFERKDRPVVLCKTDKIRIQHIIEETINSYLKSQPVLILSDDDEVVKKVYDEIAKINSKLNPNILISNKNLEEEAEIIARAGIKGGITVASEMAGRGTDIKLGGFSSKTKDEILIDVLLEKTSDFFEKSGTEKAEDIFARVFASLKLEYETYDYYKKEIDNIVDSKIKKLTKEMFETGGLKYIQVNPFRTTRNDNQGKGRVGRAGEPGETIMYATLDDLSKLGADKEDLQDLGILLGENETIDDIYANGMISDVIHAVQQNNEYKDNIKIASTDTMDFAMSSIGFRILKQRTNIILSDDITSYLDTSIQSIVDDILYSISTKKEQRKISQASYKLSKIEFSYDKLNYYLMNIFGLEISIDEVFKKCTDVSDLKQLISDKAMSKLEKVSNKNKVKNALLEQVNQVYKDFLHSAKLIELQQFNDKLAGNNSHNRISELDAIYRECNLETLKKTIKNIFKPNLKTEKKENFTNSVEISTDLPTIEDLLNKNLNK